MFRRTVIALSLAGLTAATLVAVGPTATARVAGPRDFSVATATATAFAVRMLKLVNAERTKVGVAPLVLCAKLSSAAQAFARVMARRDYYNADHIGPDGSRPQDRVLAEGYRWTRVGENEAAGQRSVRSVMAAWVKSPGHYANITNPGYKHVGFGHGFSESSTYGHYWVQDFGAGGRC